MGLLILIVIGDDQLSFPTVVYSYCNLSVTVHSRFLVAIMFTLSQILLQNLVRTGEEMGSRERRVVFVTVGTTCFDALVKAVDSEEVKEALLHKGYTDLLIQMGRGTYMPSKVTIFSVLLASFII